VEQFHWDPASYLSLMHEEVPDYEEIQNETAAAVGTGAQRVLELGTGTGETSRPADAVTPIDDGYDMPSTVADQLRWLKDAPISARVSWSRRDLAVLVGHSPTGD
jgi:tRNA (cmo5U34)-methyltransferase